jgi:starvation-inducible DNA-binding protein
MKVQDFRDYHLLLDEQAEQIFAITDNVGARAQDWRNALSPFLDDMSHHQGSRTNPVRRMKMKA